MGKHYKAKTFKSGNSVALRLPAAMGVEPGREMRIDGDANDFTVKSEPAQARTIDVDAFWGKAPGLSAFMPESREFDERPSSRLDGQDG